MNDSIIGPHTSMRALPRARGERACGASGAFGRVASADPHASVSIACAEGLERYARIRLARIERGFGTNDRARGAGGESESAPRVRSASYARRAAREEPEGVIETPGRGGGARGDADADAGGDGERSDDSYASEDSGDGFEESEEVRSFDREGGTARYAGETRREEASE